MSISRRGFLKGVGGGVAVASFASMFGLHDVSAADYNAQNHDAKDTPLTIVSLAATAERLAITSYYNTIKGNPFGLADEELLYLKYALSSELHHLEVVESFGGKALADKFYVPAKFLSDFGVNTNTFMAAETAFTGAYLAATRRFAELGEPRIAATTAQHAATEAEHLALTREIGGYLPNPNTLPAPIFYNVSDAVPVLGPFLQGGTGFIGPVDYPGADAVRALLGKDMALKVPPFTQVF